MVIDTLQKWYNGHIFGPLTGFFFGKETKEFFQELGDIWIDEKWEKRDFIHNTLYNSIFNRNSTNFVQFILTRRCNIKCPNCNVPLSANYEISLQEWKDIISLLDEHFNPKLISISGGEPLLRYDNLIKIISQCTDKNIPTSLNTNGLLLSTSIIRELRDVGLTLLAVSYDGIKPKSDPKIIDNAILANNLGIDTTLQLTISDKNIHKAYEIKEIAYKNGLGISSLIIQNLNNLFSSDAYAQPNSEFVKEYYSELINDKKNVFNNKHVRGGIKFYKFIKNNYPQLWHCNNYNWFTFNEDGRLMHCQEISPSDYRIDDIIENPKEFQEYREKKASECTGCQYNCYIDAENTGLNRFKEIPKLDYRTKNVLFLRTLDNLIEKLERKTVNG